MGNEKKKKKTLKNLAQILSRIKDLGFIIWSALETDSK